MNRWSGEFDDSLPNARHRVWSQHSVDNRWYQLVGRLIGSDNYRCDGIILRHYHLIRRKRSLIEKTSICSRKKPEFWSPSVFFFNNFSAHAGRPITRSYLKRMSSFLLVTSDYCCLLEFQFGFVFTGGDLLSFFRMKLIEVRFANTEDEEYRGRSSSNNQLTVLPWLLHCRPRPVSSTPLLVFSFEWSRPETNTSMKTEVHPQSRDVPSYQSSLLR